MKVVSALTFLFVTFIALPAFAGDASTASAAGDYLGHLCIGAGLAIGIAAAGGGMGQAAPPQLHLKGLRAIHAAGKFNGPMILGLALIESLVIYAFVIAILRFEGARGR